MQYFQPAFILLFAYVGNTLTGYLFSDYQINMNIYVYMLVTF